MSAIYRDNADDFMSSGMDFQQAWLILGGAECPPSIEVFEHAYVESQRVRPELTAQQFAHEITAKYQRNDTHG